MRLLSVNVAQPTEVLVGGRQITTSILKHPVKGLVEVKKLNLQGDRQADLTVHGGPDKAVYVYSWNNALYWSQSLQRDDLRPGTFGENLTVDDLGEEDVAIGDNLVIGTATLQVTQPRRPCYKLGIALGIQGFQETFLASGRTGFYLRVLQEGALSEGDSITLVGNAEVTRVTVAELAQILHTRQATDAQVARILSLRSLPESWKSWVKRKLQNA